MVENYILSRWLVQYLFLMNAEQHLRVAVLVASRSKWDAGRITISPGPMVLLFVSGFLDSLLLASCSLFPVLSDLWFSSSFNKLNEGESLTQLLEAMWLLAK